MKLQPLPLTIACSVCCWLGGCSTFNHQAVDSNVVRCRQRCQAGLEATRHGRCNDAQQIFATAVDACPSDERARRLYAEALWREDDIDGAIEHMAEAVRLSGGDPNNLVRLGQMHLARGEIDKAAKQAARAIAAAPELAEAWALEGDVFSRHGRDDAALSRYHRALAYRNSYPEVQFAVADIYARQGRHRRALATLAALSGQYPPDRVPQRLHAMRGQSYRSLKRYGEAASEFSLAVKAAPPTPDLLYDLAASLAASGDYTAARMTAEQALSLQPQHVRSRQLLANLGSASPGGLSSGGVNRF